MKIWVAGSRTITNYKFVAECLFLNVQSDDVIRTGGAKGVDRIAEMWAKNNGIQLEEPLIPDWKMGKGAGFKRNTEGVEWADRVIIIWDGMSNDNISGGSKHVSEEAARLNKQHIIFRY